MSIFSCLKILFKIIISCLHNFPLKEALLTLRHLSDFQSYPVIRNTLINDEHYVNILFASLINSFRTDSYELVSKNI